MAVLPQVDTRDLKRLVKVCETAPERTAKALRMAVNDAGGKALTVTKRALAKQTGLTYTDVGKGVKVKPATDGDLTYEIRSRGETLSLRSFGATQRKKGVSARPWGKRRVFRGTFIIRSLGGQVFRRRTRDSYSSGIDSLWGGGGTNVGRGVGGVTGKPRDQLIKLWGPAMPKEMLAGPVTQAFGRAGAAQYRARLAHHMQRLFPNIGST